MFGYPTGLGALIARRRTLERLQRPWFSGGTVVAANVQGDMVVPHSGHAQFEDGTVDYLGIPAVEIGLRHIERIGIDTISQRVESLGTWLLEELQQLKHSDGARRCASTGRRRGTAAGARSRSTSCTRTGPWSTNAWSTSSRRRTTSRLRTGASATRRRRGRVLALQGELASAFEDGMILDDYIGLVGMPTGGAVRASLGLASNFADVYRFMAFATEFADLTDVPSDLPARPPARGWTPDGRGAGAPGAASP